MGKGKFDLIAYGSVLVLGLGMLKQLLFYYAFNIPIKYFLGIPDLGLFISEDFLLIIPCAIILIYHIRSSSKLYFEDKRHLLKLLNNEREIELEIVRDSSRYYALLWEQKELEKDLKKDLKGEIKKDIYVNLEKVTKELKEIECRRKERKYTDKQSVRIKVLLGVALILGLSLSFITIPHPIKRLLKAEYVDLLNLPLLIFFFFFLSVRIIKLIYKKLYFRIFPEQQFYSIALSLFVIISIICTKTSGDIKDIKKGRFTGTIIQTNDSIYRSNTKSYFVGKTSDYTFIYDSINGSTIIPNDKIEKLVLNSR